MKFNLVDRTVTCCLLGAATLAVASGMSKVDRPADADEAAYVAADSKQDDENPSEQEDAVVEPSEESIRELVKAVAQASAEDKQELRNKLKEALSAIFQKRTSDQRNRIASMREKLEAIESQLEKRSELEEQIVDRRLSELLGEKDELSWDHEPPIILDSLGELGKLGERFRFEFPMDMHRLDMAKKFEGGMTKYKAAQESFGKAMADLDKKKAAQSRKQAEQASKNADIEPKQMRDAVGRLRDLERKLSPLESIKERRSNEIVEERKLGNVDEAAVLALRAQIEAMRAQSARLEKQFDEVSRKKQKSEDRK